MAETTTIRVSLETRNRLNHLARKRGEPAGEVVSQLVAAADDEALLADAEAAFQRLSADPEALAAYRAETTEIQGGFDTALPDW